MNNKSQKRKDFANKIENEPDMLYSHLMEINTGVIAIIMTIIVLEIKPPLNMAHYVDFIHDIEIFLITFIIVAKFWYDLHNIYAYFIYRPGKKIVVLDMLLLTSLSLMPVMAKWVMMAPNSISISNYGVVYLFANLFISGLQIVGFKENFEINSQKTAQVVVSRIALAIIFNLILIGLSFIAPRISMILYLGFPIMSFIFRSGFPHQRGMKKPEKK